MGKGDQKSRRGKIQVGSFGNVRPRKKATAVTAEQIAAGAAAKKAASKKAAK